MVSLPVAATRPFRKAGSFPLLIWIAAFIAALIVGVALMELPVGDLWIIVVYLVASATISSAAGMLVYRLTEVQRRSIRTKVLLAHALGAAIVIVNIFAAAQLMFISAHDLGLLMLLLVACAVFSVTFGAAVADRMTMAVEALSAGAREVAQGNFATRVEVVSNDELADLARSFNEMVAHVNRAAEMRDRAEDSRRELVVAVSHDLRTPLTAIRAMLEALSDGLVDDPDTVRRYHDTMRAQVEHLSRLIDDLFELSQLDTGGPRLDLRRVDLGVIVADAVESFAMSAATRQTALRLDLADSVLVDVEPVKIARVVNNLIENAIRFAPAGTSVDVSVARAGNDALVAVSDRGEGIDAADLPYLFDRFYRGEKSRSREFGGAGLGLAIARGIVEAHGGTIDARNDARGGAVVSFSLPVAGTGQLRD
ncbi:MAG TPA: ATP-binding protein [Thermomicrobiales bacterium]|nr:ATP-binding protein [Thermomicrobiales bacterium]